MDISMQIVWAEKRKIQRKNKNGNRQTWKKVKKLKNIRDREKITIYTWIEIKRDIKLEMIQMKEKNSNATII